MSERLRCQSSVLADTGRLSCLALALACLLLPSAHFLFAEQKPLSEESQPSLADSFFAERRTALAKKVKDGIVIVRAAEDTPTQDSFRQNNNFYYLTGIEAPDGILVLIPSTGAEHIFARKTPAISRGIAEVHKCEEFEKFMSGLVRKVRAVYVPLQHEEIGSQNLDTAVPAANHRAGDPWDGRETRETAFKRALEKKFKGCRVADLSPTLFELRRVKTDAEISMVEEACRITGASLADTLPTVKPGMHEYEVAAQVEFGFRKRRAQGPAYGSIIAAGKNALNFHHIAGDDALKDGELVLLDVGASFGYYAADVTRTWPVNGKFSEEQRKLYDAVLKAQEAAIAAVKPGITLKDVHEKALDSLRGDGLDKYVGHFICHYVGMAAHDPGDADKALAPGVVFTIEPGIYIADKGIGIRIEDTVVVTKDGCRVLSAGAPKRAEEIERAMAK